MEKIRIQKMLSECGVSSRRKAEEIISKGCVTINGRLAKIGDKVDPKKDKIRVNGEDVSREDKKYYIMLYKPRGFISTMNDEKNRKCVSQLALDVPARVYPVGRLDKDSEGMLLMTNDGDFANLIMHPANHMEKKYRVTVKPGITEEQIVKMCTGVKSGEEVLAAKDVSILKSAPDRVVLEITLTEGRNRHIRKMCEALGLKVARLKRTSIGTVKLGMLQPGKWRELTTEELRRLKKKQ